VLLPHDHYYRDFVAWVDRLTQANVILDLGTFHKYRKELEPFADRFRARRYVAMDFHVRRSVARDLLPDVDGDIHHLPFATACADAVICKDVLEHLPLPHLAVAEIHRVLKPGGILYCSIPFLYPYHGDGTLKNTDFYRFTLDGIRYLFRGFAAAHVIKTGGLVFIARAFCPPRVARWIFARPLMLLWNLVDRAIPTRTATAMHLIFAVK